MDHIGDEGPGMSSNGTQSNPSGNITRSVFRAPATAQEGEAFTLISYIVAAGRLRGKDIWLVADSLSSEEALQSYHQCPKAHGMMSQIFSQSLGGQTLRPETCV